MKFIQDNLPLSILFVISPAIGYIPQLVTRDILFSPLISMFFIMSNILKLFHYNAERYSTTLLFQSAFVILLHMCLILMNRRPLGTYEARIFKNRPTRLLYRNYGVKGCVLGMICAFIFLINILGILYGSYKLCGGISSALEVGVNLFQLMMEREEKSNPEYKSEVKRSPKELYFCWIVGDVVKIWFMANIATPVIFIGTVVVQILIDIFLIFS